MHALVRVPRCSPNWPIRALARAQGLNPSPAQTPSGTLGPIRAYSLIGGLHSNVMLLWSLNER